MIEGANGSLYHSAFAEAASQYAYDHGVVQTFSGDDLNTGNHNYPANYGHAMLIQGTVPDTVGLGEESSQWVEGRAAVRAAADCRPASAPTLPVGTFFRGANTTQYGGKSSISMEGPTGSVNTSKASGAAGARRQRRARPRHRAAPRRDARAARADRRARADARNTAGAGVPDPGADPTLPRRRAVDVALRLGPRRPRRRGRRGRQRRHPARGGDRLARLVRAADRARARRSRASPARASPPAATSTGS